jgi:hypothetical protein
MPEVYCENNQQYLNKIIIHTFFIFIFERNFEHIYLSKMF